MAVHLHVHIRSVALSLNFSFLFHQFPTYHAKKKKENKIEAWLNLK